MKYYNNYNCNPKDYDPDHSYLFFKIKDSTIKKDNHPIAHSIHDFLHHFKDRMDHLHDSTYKLKRQADETHNILAGFKSLLNKIHVAKE